LCARSASVGALANVFVIVSIDVFLMWRDQ